MKFIIKIMLMILWPWREEYTPGRFVVFIDTIIKRVLKNGVLMLTVIVTFDGMSFVFINVLGMTRDCVNTTFIIVLAYQLWKLDIRVDKHYELLRDMWGEIKAIVKKAFNPR